MASQNHCHGVQITSRALKGTIWTIATETTAANPNSTAALANADDNAPYQFAINLEAGVYTLSAIATDVAGNSAESVAIDVGIDEAPPTDDAGEGPSEDAGDDGDAPEGDGSDEGDGDDRGADATDPALPPGFGLDGADQGCGCATDASPTSAWLVTIPLLVRRRRTRTRAR